MPQVLLQVSVHPTGCLMKDRAVGGSVCLRYYSRSLFILLAVS